MCESMSKKSVSGHGGSSKVLLAVFAGLTVAVPSRARDLWCK